MAVSSADCTDAKTADEISKETIIASGNTRIVE
jgi:hypothetical protein